MEVSSRVSVRENVKKRECIQICVTERKEKMKIEENIIDCNNFLSCSFVTFRRKTILEGRAFV